MAGSRATVTPRHGPLGSLLLLAAQAALSLVSDALVPGSTLGDCAFGTEPGYWNRQKFVLFNASCALEPILDKALMLAQRGDDVSVLDFGNILSIGDSIDRKVISALTDELGQEMDYYTPMKYKTLPSGKVKPEQTGKNAKITVGPVQFANFFIFGAGDGPYFDLFYKAAAIPLLHNTTSERICKDAPVFTDPFMPKGPDMLIMASNFWDAAMWWEQGYAERDDQSLREQIVEKYLQDVQKIMDKAKKCFPHAKVYCWRTHPILATDERNTHFESKRPHVVAALNQAGRLAASKKGWCLLDLEAMVAGHANEKLWMPDGLHPSDFVLKEYANMALNTLYQAKGWEASLLSSTPN